MSRKNEPDEEPVDVNALRADAELVEKLIAGEQLTGDEIVEKCVAWRDEVQG